MSELSSISDYFTFLGRKISTHEIQSMLPFFDCEEPGHQGNALDQVCLDQECKLKGLCCVRCSYQKHRFHSSSIYPLHTFVGQLIEQMQSRRVLLQEQKKKCSQYRDVVISLLRDYVNNIIDHLSVVVAQIHKYHTLFENSFENILVKGDIIVHSLVHKKHIQKHKFDKYVRESIISVNFTKEVPKPINDYYSLQQMRPQKLDDRFRQENGTIIIHEQEKANEMANKFVEEMHKVAKNLSNILKQSQEQLIQEVDLHNLSPSIPKFEQASYNDIIEFKKQFNIKNIF